VRLRVAGPCSRFHTQVQHGLQQQQQQLIIHLCWQCCASASAAGAAAAQALASEHNISRDRWGLHVIGSILFHGCSL
jgi:hypothetical protein